MIETAFTIKQVSVDEALKQAEQKAEKTARKIDKSLNGVGNGTKTVSNALEEMGRGMDSVQKMGGSVGGVMKNATEAIKGMLSPVGLVSVAFTALTAVIVKAWNRAKEELEKTKARYDWEYRQASGMTSQTMQNLNADNGYMTRLQEINSMENVDNATKLEAIRIIENLTRHYGDLGLSIDGATGKISGLNEAMRKQTELAQEEAKASLQAALSKKEGQLGVAQKQVHDKAWYRSKEADLVASFAPYSDEERSIINNANGQYAMPDTVRKAKEIRERHLQDARSAYIAVNGMESASDLNLHSGWKPNDDDSEAVKKLAEQANRAREAMENAPDGMKQTYRDEYEYLMKMQGAQRKIDTAYRMQGNGSLSEEEQQKWRRLHEEAQEYYALLLKMKNLSVTGRTEETVSQGDSTKNAGLQGRLDRAKGENRASQERVARKQTEFDQVGYTKDQMYAVMVDDERKANDRIQTEKAAVEALTAEYGELQKQLEAAEAKKQDGRFASVADEKEYLRLNAEMLEKAVEREEAEKRVAEAKLEQLELAKKIKVADMARHDEQRKQEVETARKTLAGLFKGVFGDVSERTDALRQRGGYLSRDNSVNGNQVNRQILMTVTRASQYLANIKQKMANVGVI